jgi:hypothetical protein
VLDAVAASQPGRIIGMNNLWPRLSAMAGLRDVRGYDGIEPARLMELILQTRDGQASSKNPFARLQYMVPYYAEMPPHFVKLPPLLDLAGVRYLVFRGEPPGQTTSAFSGPDYSILVNPAALPRPFVPGQVHTVAGEDERLRQLASVRFNPRKLALVESRVDLPESCKGDVRIVSETPRRIAITVQAETACLVVLADLWDKGWHATVNGTEVPVLRADHAFRGILVPSGTSEVRLRYEPASVDAGWCLFAVAAALLGVWILLARRHPVPSDPSL